MLISSLIALPLWSNFLQGWIGRFITIEQIHLVEYAGLGILAGLYGKRSSVPNWKLLLGLGLIGFGDEALQGFIPGRFFQWSDVFLNWAGGLLGGLAYWLFSRETAQSPLGGQV